MSATVFYESSSELATLSNTFTVSGVATDPTAVVLVVTSPSGTATTYNYPSPATITRTGTGAYTKDIPCTESGVWQYVWTGTGTASDVVAGSWTVAEIAFQNLYCTPEALKSRRGISDSYDDREILSACEATSRWIDEHCDRVFARRSITITLEPCGQYSIATPDLVSVTTLKTDNDGDGTFETTWATSDYELQPVNAALEIAPMPYTAIAAVGSQLFPTIYPIAGARLHRVQIAGVFGWPSLPAPVAEAAAILAGDYLKLGGMSFGVAGYGEYGAVRARLSSPALSMLMPYRRYPVLVG